nr:integrase, catalytic region, zinc finger, CCHC-type, peptidase aspartic, catalytic [Tanacetum cinerariifolium]
MIMHEEGVYMLPEYKEKGMHKDGVSLKMACLTKAGSSPGHRSISDFVNKTFTETSIIPSRPLVQIVGKCIVTKDGLTDELQHEKQQETITDPSISRSRHVELERELEPWVSDDDKIECRISRAYSSSSSVLITAPLGWDQIETNAALFGVTSTVDEELYTTKLDRGPMAREKEREALSIAREIEGEDTQDLHLAKGPTTIKINEATQPATSTSECGNVQSAASAPGLSPSSSMNSLNSEKSTLNPMQRNINSIQRPRAVFRCKLEPDLPVPVPESFHEQTNEELTKNDFKWMDADDQAILLGLPEDFLNSLQPEWKRHVTILRQTKNLHEADFTQIYDFLKMNQDENGGIQVAQNAVQNAGVQNGGNHNGLVVVPGIANQNGTGNIVTARGEGTGNRNQARCYNCGGLGHIARNCIARPRRRDDAYLQTQLLTAQKEEARIQLQAEEFDFMAAVGDLDEIEEVNANRILMANLQHASTSGMVQCGGTVKTGSAPNEETRAHPKIVYRNLVQVAHVNMEDKYLDKEVDLKSKIKGLKNILLKKDQTVQTMHMLNPKPDSFYYLDQKMALGYPNPLYLKKAQLKQQSLYNGNLLLEEHDPPAVGFCSSNNKSKEELFLSNVSNMVTVSKTISIPNEDLSDDTTPSVAQKFLNEVKSSLVTLQRVVKQKVTLEVHNWSSFAHKEVYKIISHKIAPIINQVDARVQNFEIQFLQEAAKFVRDFKSLAKKADESLDKQKSLELEIEWLLKASVSHDIMSIVQNGFVDVPSDLQTKLDWTSVTPQVDKPKLIAVTPYSKKLHASTPSHSVPQPREFNAMKHSNENASSNTVNASSTGLVHTARTRRPQPKGTVRFGNDHIAVIMGYGDLKWGNITITRVYFVEGLGHNLFLVGQFCDADLEVAFRRNTCFIRDLDGVNLLKGNRSKNLYTINLYDTALASPICLMARATLTKSWLWHQRLSQLSFDTINDLAKNDLVSGLPKFKYDKEHLCPSCEQGKGKRASHPPKPVLNSKQRLHLLHMDLCGPLRVASINGKRYVLVIVDDYSRYTWVHFLRTKDETPEQNRVVERINRMLVEAAKTMLIFSHAPLFLWAEAIATACYTQNRSIIHRRFNKTPYELIQGKKSDISYLHVFGALCYRKNDREDIGKLGVKGDIGFFIGYFANSISYRVYSWRTKKIIEMMNVTFDELSAMAFEQNSLKSDLQSLTSRQISFGLELTYAPSTITPQRPSEHDLVILFEPLHNEYLGGQPSEAPRTIHVAPVIQNLQASSASMSIQNSAPTPTNSSNTLISSHNVDEQSQPHAQQQGNHTSLPTASAADDVLNAVFEGDLFVNPFATPSTEFVLSSTQYVDPSDMHTFYQPYLHDYQWTIDHPLEQVIEPSRPVFTRNQLKYDGDMCIYALTVSILEPKLVKEALTDPAWIESKQEKLHQFIRLDIWELVSSSDGIKPLTLKWLFKNKHDEENTVICNKTHLVGTINMGLWYTKDSGFELTGFSDADYAGCKDTFKTTSGGAQFFGEKLVSWSSKKQDCTSLLTAKSEYVSLSACCAQVLWMRTQLTDYGYYFDKIPIYCDSKSVIAISCNPV